MSRSAGHDQRNAAFREVFLKPLEFAAGAPPTAQQLTTTAEKLGLEHSVEDVPNSTQQTKIHWLGDRTSSKTLLYFHGGGFSLPMLEGHVKFLGQSIERLRTNGKGLNVAVLEYALCPVAKYPVQIIQAAEALHFLLAKGIDPSAIIMGGDSAGGNMTLAVLSIIAHGFEGVQPFKFNKKLAGALLISPWVSFKGESNSWRENITKDVISHETTHELVGIYANKPEEFNNYSEPIRADSAWWKDLAVEKILNVYGDNECLRDEQAHMSKVLKEGGNAVQDAKCAQQVHVDNILDAQTDMEAGEMSHVIWEWLEKMV